MSQKTAAAPKKQSWLTGPNLAFAVSLIGLVVVSYWGRLQVLNYRFGYDEGIHLIWSKLWAAGYTPYEEIFVSYPPFFIWSLGWPWKLYSQAGAIQLLMGTYALTGVLAVVYLGYVYDGRLAGIAAGVLLSFAPSYLIPSIEVMGEVPSVGMAVAAIALTEQYRRHGGWGWLGLAGSTLALSLSLKVLPIYAIPLLGLLVISRHVTTFRPGALFKTVLIRDLAILAGAFILVFLLPTLFFDWNAFYDQVIGMRFVSRATEANPYDSQTRDIVNFVFDNLGLTALALYGLVFVIGRTLKRTWPLLVWFILVWLSMSFHVPLRGKHLPIFVPVLALFAGLAASHIYRYLAGQFRRPEPSLRLATMLLILATLLAMFGWDTADAVSRRLQVGEAATSIDEPERQHALAFIKQVTTPQDCIIADDPVFVYESERLPPPELAEVTHTRIDTGFLTVTDMEQIIEEHACQAVAILTPRFLELPGLTDWLAANYLALDAQSGTFVYFAKLGADQRYTPHRGGDFGNLVRLFGARLEPTLGRERQGHLSLYWQLAAPLQGRYLVEIRLYDAQSRPVYQIVRPMFEGKFSPETWQVGQKARDTFWSTLPPDLPAGPYQVFVSLCEADSGRCLPVDQNGNVAEVLIGTIVVEG